MSDDVIAYQLGELAEMQAVRKRGPMIDRDRLREALKQLELRGANTASHAAKDGIGSDLVKVIEAARLVASETTLIVEKVNGEWVLPPEMETRLCSHFPSMATVMRSWLDALLAQQTGDTG